MFKFLLSSRVVKIAAAIFALTPVAVTLSSVPALADVTGDKTYTPVIDPTPGSVESLQTFTITFNGAEKVETTFSRDACPELWNTTTNNRVMTFTSGSVDGNKLTLKTNTAITVSGKYQLKLPAAAYKLDDIQSTLGDLTWDYTIAADPFEFTVTPADGTTITNFTSVVVKFPNATSISVIENAAEDYPTVQLYDEEDEDYYEATTINYADPTGNELTFKQAYASMAVASGKYKVLIPAGTIKVGDDTNKKDITSTFILKQAVPEFTATIDPAEGKVTSLQNFYLSVSGDGIDKIGIGTGKYIYLKKGADEYYPQMGDGDVYQDLDKDATGKTLAINFTKLFNTAGSYSLIIPAGAITVNGYATDKDLKFEYTIEEAAAANTLEYTISPVADENGNVNSIQIITVKYTNASTIEEIKNSALVPTLEIKDLRGNYNEVPVTWTIEGNEIRFKLDDTDFESLNGKGEVRLTVPAGCFNIDGTANEAIEKEFNYVADVADQPYATFEPKPGQYLSLWEFKVTIPSATTVEFDTSAFSNGKLPKLVGINDTKGSASMAASGYSAEGNVLTFKVGYSEFKEPGEYQLQIPGECFKADGVAGKDIVSDTYTIAASDTSFEYSVNPADGAETSYASVVITFANAAEIAIDDTVDAPILEKIVEGEDPYEYDVVATVTGNQLTITPASYVTLGNGTYKLTIAANYIKIAGESFNNAIETTFKYSQPVPEFTTTLTPEPGSKVKSLKSIDIVFSGIDSFAPNNYTSATQYYIEDTEANKTIASEAFVNNDAEGAPLHLEFTEITTPGEYTLVLPAESYKVNGILGNELRFNYTVDDKIGTINETSIANSAESIANIYVSFDNAVSIAAVEGENAPAPVVEYYSEKARGQWIEVPAEVTIIGGNTLQFTIAEGDQLEGEYRVTIPAGAYNLTDKDGNTTTNAEIVETLSYKAAVDKFAYTVTPSGNEKGEIDIASFERVVTVTFTNAEAVEDAHGDDYAKIEYYAEKRQAWGEIPELAFSSNTITITLAEGDTNPGDYRITIPVGSIKVDGEANTTEIVINFKLVEASGVASIFTNGVQSVDVYDLRGVRVLRNANADALRNLNSNIYIINGKKYLLRN